MLDSAFEKVIILGGGGHARELHAYTRDLIRAGWSGELLGFLDDHLPPGITAGLEVLGPLDIYDRVAGDHCGYITALGNNLIRLRVVERIHSLTNGLARAWTLIHPLAYRGQEVEIGEGTCMAPGSMATARVIIGRHSILNVKASVSHDCVIGDFVNINPSATICGNVRIGEGAYIGAGAVVKEKISIGAWSIIGAGAAVVQDIPPNVTAVGVPARIIKRHDFEQRSAS
jgi:acetyltransferase EpsM